MPLLPTLAGLCVGVLGTTGAALLGEQRVDRILTAVQVATALLAIGAAWALEDGSRETLEPSPTSAALRTLLRQLLALGLVAACWAGLLAAARWLPTLRAGEDLFAETGLPVAAPTIELLTLLSLGWLAAAVGNRWMTPTASGGIGGAAVVFTLVLLNFTPSRWMITPVPGAPAWDHAHVLWAQAGIVMLAVVAALSGDAGRKLFRHRFVAGMGAALVVMALVAGTGVALRSLGP